MNNLISNILKEKKVECPACSSKNHFYYDECIFCKHALMSDAEKRKMLISLNKPQKLFRIIFVMALCFFVVSVVVAIETGIHKYKEVPIEYVQYNNSLETGDYCYSDIQFAFGVYELKEYLVSNGGRMTEYPLGDNQTIYYAFNQNGDTFLVCCDNDDTDKFQELLETENDEHIFYGEIIEISKDINIDHSALEISSLLNSDNLLDNINEQKNEINNFLDSYPIMKIDFEESKTKTVEDGFGIGFYFAVFAAILLMTVFVCKYILNQIFIIEKRLLRSILISNTH